jgi:hypothetical protein
MGVSRGGTRLWPCRQAVADPCMACAGEAESRSMPDSEQEEENHMTFDTSRLYDQGLSSMHDI